MPEKQKDSGTGRKAGIIGTAVILLTVAEIELFNAYRGELRDMYGPKVTTLVPTPTLTGPQATATVAAVATERANHLHQTATAVEKRGLNVTYDESLAEIGVTPEILDEVARGIWGIKIDIGDTKIGLTIASQMGTAWMVQQSGLTGTNIVTCEHVIEPFLGNGFGIQDMQIMRPMDGTYFPVTPNEIALSGSPDVALINVNETMGKSMNAETFPYRDNYLPKRGEKLFVVGFPAELRNPDLSKTILSAQVITITEDARAGLLVKGIADVDHGGSGGAVFKMIDGRPVAVGIMAEINKFDAKEALFWPLNIDKLIQKMKIN